MKMQILAFGLASLLSAPGAGAGIRILECELLRPIDETAFRLERDAGFAAAKAEFDAYVREKAQDVSHEMHLPYLLDHGRRTRSAVVLIHGLYESPHYLKGIANAFHAKGMNVVTVLLPGHWTRPPEKMDQATREQWRAEVARGIAMAKKLGEQVVLAGYSTGGLLAVDAALEAPEDIKGVFAWAPSLGLRPSTSLKVTYGTVFNVTGNSLNGHAPDGKLVPYLSARAGMEVSKLQDEFLNRHAPSTQLYPADPSGPSVAARRQEAYRKLKTPLFLVNTQSDQTIDPDENLRLFREAGGPKALIQYTEHDGVDHNRISKTVGDEYFLAPKDINPHFAPMTEKLSHFIDDNDL